MKARDLLREKREQILQMAAKNGARNVRVFGSVVRGEAEEGSDIDFLGGNGTRKVFIRSWRPTGGPGRVPRMSRGRGNRKRSQTSHLRTSA